jgi:hypothetical protein
LGKGLESRASAATGEKAWIGEKVKKKGVKLALDLLEPSSPLAIPLLTIKTIIKQHSSK